jgi:hypothetical protein
MRTASEMDARPSGQGRHPGVALVAWKRLCAASLLTAGIAGCGQAPSSLDGAMITPRVGSGGAIVMTGSKFAPSTTYNVGIYTVWSPRVIGAVRSDPAGNIPRTVVQYAVDQGLLEYSCASGPRIELPLTVGVYTVDGLGITQLSMDRSACR